MPRDHHAQVLSSLTGFGFGCFLGGMVGGGGADLLQLPVSTLVAYAVGAVVGGIGGLIAGRIAGSIIFS